MRQIRFAAAAVVFCASSLLAVTYLVPTDAQLVSRADLIVIGRAVTSYPHYNRYGAIVTTAEIAVETVLKGDFDTSTHLLLSEAGGQVGGSATMVPGAPRYADGQRYLIFVSTRRPDPSTYGMGLGRFEFATDRYGRRIVTRGDAEEGIFGFDEGIPDRLHQERARLEEPFLDFIKAAVAGSRATTVDYFVDQPHWSEQNDPRFATAGTSLRTGANSLRADYLTAGNFRWENPSPTIVVNGSEPGFDGPGAVQSAIANWNSGGGGVNYLFGGSSTATGGLAGLGRGFVDGVNCVLLNDPFDDLSMSSVPAGVVGLGGISTTSPLGPYMLGGETFNRTQEVDIVIAKASSLPVGLNQATFTGVMTHEMGHTLGFRHSDQQPSNDPNSLCAAPLPCAGVGQAIMAHAVAFNLQTLQQYDRDAVSTVYGSGPVCNAPAITAQPQSSSISQGQPAMLSVGATGTSLSFQWFVGMTGNTASGPVGTSASISVSPQSTTSYWVRVSSGCGAPAADSTTATVTVTPVCPAISITSQPQSALINSGGSATLSVAATGGTGLTFQWFRGQPVDTSNPVAGATSTMLTVMPASDTTFWVRVTNSCGSTANSVGATVSICVGPAITFPPQDQMILSGQSANLFIGVQGSSPITITWFRGARPDTSNPVGTGSNFTTPPLTTTTTFWARASNQCGQADANTVTVTVGQCTAPAISAVTASATSVTPTSPPVSLSVTATGTSLTYQWFTGTMGNTSAPIAGATTASINVQPQTTTSYWVRVTSGCGAGSADSQTVTITVGSCTSPTISTQPRDTSVSGGSATLTVIAAGTTPLHYQWFQATTVFDTSKPVGSDSSSFTTPALVKSTSYWVRVTNGCGTAQSRVATVSVLRHRAARH